MSVTFTQIRQTIDLQEKVKVGAGEKIVSTDKIGRKKNIEFTITKKSNKFFAYFDGEKYAGSYNNQKDVERIAKEYIQLVGEELQENRAKRDALRAMGRRKGKDAADIDTDATDDDVKAADKNIMVQLKKVVSLRGMKPVEFADKKKVKIDPKDAAMILRIYDRLKPASKMQLQTVLAKSKKDFDNAIKQLAGFKEEVELDEKKFSPMQVKQAIGIASDKRYAGGNMSGAVRAIEKLAKGLSNHKQVAAVLKRQNESVDLEEGRMKELHGYIDKGMSAQQIAKKMKLDVKTVQALMDETNLEEAGLPPHLAKLFDKDGNFKDPKKQKVFDRMMGDGIGKEIAQKMGRIRFRVQADSAKKKLKVYVDSNDEEDAQRALKNHPAYISGAMRVIPEEVELDEAPKMRYALVGTDMKIYSMGSDERDLKLDRKSLEKRFKDVAPLKMARLKTAQAIGDKVDKSQIKEEDNLIVSEKVTPYISKSFNEFVVHRGDKVKKDTSA